MGEKIQWQRRARVDGIAPLDAKYSCRVHHYALQPKRNSYALLVWICCLMSKIWSVSASRASNKWILWLHLMAIHVYSTSESRKRQEINSVSWVSLERFLFCAVLFCTFDLLLLLLMAALTQPSWQGCCRVKCKKTLRSARWFHSITKLIFNSILVLVPSSTRVPLLELTDHLNLCFFQCCHIIFHLRN